MPRKQKEKLTQSLSEPSLEYLKVSYACPECDVTQIKDLIHIPKEYQSKNTQDTITACWCNRCGSRHQLKYIIHKARNGTAQLKVIKFLSEDREHNKRFKVLTWC